jgi:hypothetical protein
MAGARAVEEMIARCGSRQFDLVMFGDEPYGNYNRILLSNILSGAQDASEIFINPLDWYGQSGIKLHAGTGARVEQIDRASKTVVSASGIRERYDKLLIATGSRSLIPPMAGVNGSDGKMRPGVFGFRSIDDCNGIVAQAKQSRRAAVIGGGLLGLEAAHGLINHGCEVHVVHLAGISWRCSRCTGGAARPAWRPWASGPSLRFWATAPSPAPPSRTAPLSTATWSTPPASSRMPRSGAAGSPSSEPSSTTTCARSTTATSTPSANAPSIAGGSGLVAPLWEQAKVLPITHRRAPVPPITARSSRPSSR